MTTLPYRRQQVTPWSGGRTTGAARNAAGSLDRAYPSDRRFDTVGSTALTPERGGPERGGAERAREAVASPRLRAAARRLGLVRSEPAYLRLSDGTVLGFPKPATGAPSASGPAQAGR